MKINSFRIDYNRETLVIRPRMALAYIETINIFLVSFISWIGEKASLECFS